MELVLTQPLLNICQVGCGHFPLLPIKAYKGERDETAMKAYVHGLGADVVSNSDRLSYTQVAQAILLRKTAMPPGDEAGEVACAFLNVGGELRRALEDLSKQGACAPHHFGPPRTAPGPSAGTV